LEDKPRALFISPESPYPPIGGGPLRSASLVEYLRKRYCLDVILFRQPGGRAPSCPGAVRTLILDLPYHSRILPARFCRNAARFILGRPPLIDRFRGFAEGIGTFVRGQTYEVAVIEHLWVAPYAPLLRATCRRIVVDLHNIESEWHRRCAEAEGGLFAVAMRRFARFAERVEADLLPQVDLTLTASEADAKRVGEIAPGARVAVYPNVLPFTPIPPQVESGPSIAFSGNFEYLPNVQAIRWFHERIWPQLRRIYPGLRWRLVGSHVEAAPRRVLSDPGVETVAAGADAISILARSSIGIAPIVSGSGTRLKILEMWAAALPVVSTHLGAEGLGARPGVEVLLADDPDQFARCVIELLEEAGRQREIGAAGRRLYEREFTWQAGWKRLESLGI